MNPFASQPARKKAPAPKKKAAALAEKTQHHARAARPDVPTIDHERDDYLDPITEVHTTEDGATTEAEADHEHIYHPVPDGWGDESDQ